MKALLRRVLSIAMAIALPMAAAAAEALSGTRQISLHARDGSKHALGEVVFTPQADGRSSFQIKLAAQGMQDHFLSMREFKCISGQGENLCVVPYPYPHPASIGPGDTAWLEHALLFMRNRATDYGAKLGDGVYFALTPSGRGFEGRLQAIDLVVIGAPPRDPAPPFKPALRDDVPLATRWFQRLSIE